MSELYSLSLVFIIIKEDKKFVTSTPNPCVNFQSKPIVFHEN